ncbi:MAG: hypothetical protein KAJ10_10785 [Thermodesulfovibrionia bacterium]|nr:hypothetical protein [Thermodesulfovibrionia bacterium]
MGVNGEEFDLNFKEGLRLQNTHMESLRFYLDRASQFFYALSVTSKRSSHAGPYPGALSFPTSGLPVTSKVGTRRAMTLQELKR